MLLTEKDIGAQVGLPGTIVAELLLQGGLENAIASSTPQFCDTDVMRAQVAAMMSSAGVRWPYVHVAMTRDLAPLVRLHAQTPVTPPRRAGAPLIALTAVVALALMLVGVVVDLYLAPWGIA